MTNEPDASPDHWEDKYARLIVPAALEEATVATVAADGPFIGDPPDDIGRG